MATVVCYDRDKAIEALKKSYKDEDIELDEDEIKNGITIEDKKYEAALEWFEFNILGGYVGDYTPVFVTINSAQ